MLFELCCASEKTARGSTEGVEVMRSEGGGGEPRRSEGEGGEHKRHLVLVNVSPITHGHALLVPEPSTCLPQVAHSVVPRLACSIPVL